MKNQNYMPLFMSYPVNYPYQKENAVTRDLNYLRDLYPRDAKKYLKRIAEILDKMDYEGSMIYDEYPDRWQMYRLAESIVQILKKEITEEVPEEKWEWISDLVQILLFHEMFQRRHGNKGKKGGIDIYSLPIDSYIR